MVKLIIRKIRSALRTLKKEGPNTISKRPSSSVLVTNNIIVIPVVIQKDGKKKSFVFLCIILAFSGIITNTLIEHFFGGSDITQAIKDFIEIATGLLELFNI